MNFLIFQMKFMTFALQGTETTAPWSARWLGDNEAEADFYFYAKL